MSENGGARKRHLVWTRLREYPEVCVIRWNQLYGLGVRGVKISQHAPSLQASLRSDLLGRLQRAPAKVPCWGLLVFVVRVIRQAQG